MWSMATGRSSASNFSTCPTIPVASGWIFTHQPSSRTRWRDCAKSVSVVVDGPDGEPVAAVSVAAIADRLPPSRLPAVVAAIRGRAVPSHAACPR